MKLPEDTSCPLTTSEVDPSLGTNPSGFGPRPPPIQRSRTGHNGAGHRHSSSAQVSGTGQRDRSAGQVSGT
eukprot:1058461-Pyramimonas_sp.AAC.2